MAEESRIAVALAGIWPPVTPGRHFSPCRGVLTREDLWVVATPVLVTHNPDADVEPTGLQTKWACIEAIGGRGGSEVGLVWIAALDGTAVDKWSESNGWDLVPCTDHSLATCAVHVPSVARFSDSNNLLPRKGFDILLPLGPRIGFYCQSMHHKELEYVLLGELHGIVVGGPNKPIGGHGPNLQRE